MFEVWIATGAVLAPLSLWWARRGWLELDRLHGAPRASEPEVIFGYLALTVMAALGLGLLVPAAFLVLRRFVIEPELEALNAERRALG